MDFCFCVFDSTDKMGKIQPVNAADDNGALLESFIPRRMVQIPIEEKNKVGGAVSVRSASGRRRARARRRQRASRLGGSRRLQPSALQARCCAASAAHTRWCP
jgi:hypothetical protein